MMRVPDFVEFVRAENAAAGMSRGLVEKVDEWGRLVARAQRIVAEVQNDLGREQLAFATKEYYDPEISAPLIAAARILDAASQAESLEPSHRLRLALCSAAAFSMYGNFPSACAVVNNARSLGEELSSRIWLGAGCFSPRLLAAARVEAIEANDHLSSAAIEALQSYLITGERRRILEVDKFLVQTFAACTDNLENLLIGYARVSLRHIELLSTRNTLSKIKSLPETVVTQLIDSGISTLLPSQFAVLCQSSLLRSNQNSLVCLPTSTGKTLIGELSIAARLNGKPGLAVYLAPYVAVGMQAARALRMHLPKPYRVHTLVGGLFSDIQIIPSRFPEVVVATPERFEGMLRRTNLLDDLRIVVADEAHVVSDGVRGVKLEALLAMMADSERFRAWLSVPDEAFVTCLWRPTARRVAIWRNNNKLTWLYAGDELRPPQAKSTTIFGTKNLVWPERMYPASHFAQTKAQSPALYANAAYLCRQMHEEHGEPVLCVCASRASSRGVAYQLANDLDPIEVLGDELVDAISYIDHYAPHLSGLKNCLRHGIAFHNAALPLHLRQLIEKTVERRTIKVVCATTTLAEGVDLPFRVTVLAEWLQWRMDTRDQQKPFGALKFRNIAGRSGRAGVFSEGDTIVFENVLGPTKFVDPQNRTASILSMMERPNEVASAVEEEVIPSEIEARKRVISSSFLAAIPENPTDSSLEKSFADKLLVRKLPNGETAHQMMTKIRADVLNGFAVAASPLRLTLVGEAASQSLFSPESCRTILNALSALPKSNDFEDVAAYLLDTLGSIPEQHNSDWSKVTSGSGSRFVVKAGSLPYVLAEWRAGTALPKIFAELPTVKKSKARDNVDDWLNGRTVSENWANNFDKFADFVDAVVEGFLPWILDACATLSVHASNNASERPWGLYRSIVEQVLIARHPDARRRDY